MFKRVAFNLWKRNSLKGQRRFGIYRRLDNQADKEKEEDMEKLKENPYFAKYAGKLSQFAEEHPDELEDKVQALEEEKKREREEKLKSLREERDIQKEKLAQRKAKGLDAVMKLELLHDKSAEEIETLWTEYHKDKEGVFAVITAHEYEDLSRRTSEFPTFLYPLPRGEGYEFMVQQFDGRECHFTPLALFQRHKENAPPCFTITHYTDLLEEKEIVLMNSEVNTEVISVHEAQLLALQIKMYYGVNAGLKFNLVRLFKNSPADFRHMDLVKEFEKYKQDLKVAQDGTWV